MEFSDWIENQMGLFDDPNPEPVPEPVAKAPPIVMSWSKDEFNIVNVNVLIGDKRYTYYISGRVPHAILKQFEIRGAEWKALNRLKKISMKIAEN